MPGEGTIAVKTYTEQLEEVQAAISAIESGSQSWRQGGRAEARGDLAALYEREAYLRRMVARETRGGLKIQLAVPKP